MIEEMKIGIKISISHQLEVNISKEEVIAKLNQNGRMRKTVSPTLSMKEKSLRMMSKTNKRIKRQMRMMINMMISRMMNLSGTIKTTKKMKKTITLHLIKEVQPQAPICKRETIKFPKSIMQWVHLQIQ
jgi:hypothetical protein